MHFILEDFSRNLQEVFRSLPTKVISYKTLGKLLKHFLGIFLMYFMLQDFSRNLREVFRSLLPKVVQRNDVKWSPSLSMLRNDI
ncbi:hypothetical protein IGI04_023220 [Brassica rapa subsp. trilocularis]|uniref:Uncharacterized protein n=1 Tax=Brassica rapa subsp. trilocularis TaxID=1813537 RepID=A0ABQ7M365_BRACM|nr:hypothetical protein IGI04_023220 [Brassica rapa subsp. trilocularis]